MRQVAKPSKALIAALRSATADLHRVNPWVGLFRFGVLGSIFLSSVVLAWWIGEGWKFWGLSASAGFFYAFWLICTHDAVHHTLIGWSWLEELLSRLISWPMFWPFGVYSELHYLHHGWNGSDLRDPERVQWTQEDYQQANPFYRWYVHHQWPVDIFVLGGMGLIVKTFVHGACLRSVRPRLSWQLWLDVSGIVLIHGSLLAVAIAYDVLPRYLLFWLVLERAIGIVVQTRAHLEHYGMWGSTDNYQLTQLYACRNLHVNAFTHWLMGGLNYHAVHHAFSGIPFNQLPEAFRRVQEVLQQHGMPLMSLEGGYFLETWRLSHQPSLIGEANTTDPTGRFEQISLGNSQLS